MSLTLVASLVPETDLLAAVGTDASLQLDALLSPESALNVDFAADAVVLTLGPYIEFGVGAGVDAHYSHTQASPSDTWVIAHGLGKRPAVTIIDSAGDEVEGSVRHDSLNQITVSFSAGFAGVAFLN